MVIANYGFIIGNFLIDFNFVFFVHVYFCLFCIPLKSLDFLFVLVASQLEFSEIVGQSFDLLTEKCGLVLNFGVFSFEFLVLPVDVIQNVFIVAQFSTGIHFEFLNDGNLLLSDLSFEILNVILPGPDMLSESLNLL